MSDDLERANEAWQRRGDTAYVRFTRHPIAWVLAVVVFATVVTVVIGFALSWFNAGKEIVSPKNVKAQYALTFDDWHSLQATATNVCSVERAEKNLDPTSDAFTQRENQRLGFEANYTRIAAEYNAHMADLFRAKIVKPRNLPRTAPSLTEAVAAACR